MQARAYAGAALLTILSAAALEAQGRWTVTLRPSKNPLPIGQCTQVNIRVTDPVTKGTPLTALGFAVSNTGNFDMTVQSAGNPAVAGQYETSSGLN